MINVEIKEQQMEYSIREAYKSLRTNLQFCGNDKKVITITSSVSGEGKSTVTLNLAVSLAESGKKVMIVDADMRRSVLLGRIAVNSNVKGLSYFLSNQSKLEEVVCSTNVENLHIIFSGPVPPNPTELLDSEVFREMLDTLRQTYDYILIDTPPLGSVIDSAIVAKISDGAIFVIQSEAISYRFACNVKAQLEKSNCPILGVVLNKVNILNRGYYSRNYEKYEK